MIMSEQHQMDDDRLKSLVIGCLQNNRKSQEAVFATFYGKMMAVCRRYTGDENQAKDILQDGFIKVFGNLDKFNFDGSLEGWIRRIMVNTAIDHTRRKKAHLKRIDEENPIEEVGSEIVDDQEEEPNEAYSLEVSDIREGMKSLSTAYRNVFNLYVFEDYSHQEIAEKLNISVGTSKSNLAKARANLKKILQKELDKRHGKSPERV